MEAALKKPVEQTKVFVSSVVEELRDEREAVKEIVESFDFLNAWVFEKAFLTLQLNGRKSGCVIGSGEVRRDLPMRWARCKLSPRTWHKS